MIGIVRAEDMEPGKRVDVTIHMITHGLVINPSFNLYDIGVLSHHLFAGTEVIQKVLPPGADPGFSKSWWGQVMECF